MTAPTIAVNAETQNELAKVLRMSGAKSAATLAVVTCPLASNSPESTASRVGIARKTST